MSQKTGHFGGLLGIRTIRTRLVVAFVLIVLLAAIAISSVTTVMGTRDGRQREISQLQSVVTLKQAEIESWVNWLHINLDIFVSGEDELSDVRLLTAGAAGDRDYEAAYNRLKNRIEWTARSMGLFEEIFLMDTDGAVRISTNAAHEKERHSTIDYFTEGMKGFYIQQPSYSLSLGKMIVVISLPINDNGATLGVLAGRANLIKLNEIMLERSGLGDTGETYLVGSNYRLLTGLRHGQYDIPVTYIRTRGADNAINGRSTGSATYPNYRDSSVIGVYRWLPDLQVALLAEQEEEEALQGTAIALMIIVGVVIAVVILVILAARLITRSITRPLAELSATASLIAAGELDRTAKVERDDEVGILAGAFNSMTAQLRKLVRNLEKRTGQLRAINEAGRQISSILHLDELLTFVANSLQKTFNYRNVGIILVDRDSGDLTLKYHSGAYEGGPDVNTLPRQNQGIVSTVARTGKPILLNDILNDPQYRVEGSGHTRAELAVPIKIGDRIVGVLDIEADHKDAFDEEDLFTSQTLADQLAIAIENAHLYEQAEELATMKERQRLARDLHDAVSQTLFSASLIAEVLPRLWERNPDEARRRLEEIRQLTRGALAEMRTLLLELRPAALMDAEPGDLLRQLAESITGRARIPVSVDIQGHCALPSEIKVALYRIAQEALNNVAKHSEATQAKATLTCRDEKIELIISDNGKGFDASAIKPDSLGLGIMRERAKDIGASVDIDSRPGRGTRVIMVWELD
jgi:signal transduction histidine kinase